MLIDNYFKEQLKYEALYGIKTLVLIEVGSFFELYGVNNDTEQIGDLKNITEILNIQLTRRNKHIQGNCRKNALMAGFPSVSLDRFVNILLEEKYTVVLIEQVTDPPYPKREVTKIYSPGTYIDKIKGSDSNYILSLFIQEELCHRTNKSKFIIGISVIDLSTAESVVYEKQFQDHHISSLMEDCYRFIETYNPKEILIHTSNIISFSQEDLNKQLSLPNRLVHVKYNEVNKMFFKVSYQNQFLNKIYKEVGFLSPIEFLDMEKMQSALVSFIIVLHFTFEHNPDLIQKLDKPNIWKEDKHLLLYSNTIYQLNVIKSDVNHDGSLFSIINKTSTSMGKRLLRNRLLNPITDVEELNKRYESIESVIKSDKAKKLEEYLRDIIDIERCHRKISLGNLNPCEFTTLNHSYENILQLIHQFEEIVGQKKCVQEMIKFKEYMGTYRSHFDLIEMAKYNISNIESSIFNRGQYSELDEIQDNINSIMIYFQTETRKLSDLIDIGNNYVKFDSSDKDGYYFYLTKKRFEILKPKLPSHYSTKKYNTTSIKLTSSDLESKSDKIIALKYSIKTLSKKYFITYLQNIDTQYGSILKSISSYIATIDLVKSSVIIALENGYTKPKIIKADHGYFNVKSIRHPIIEKLGLKSKYVSNDIELGKDKTGLLLFGINGSGKSSLSKAIGLNIILAQAGFFVAANQFEFSPYSRMFTRITGDDNIFKGHSSFVVEMSELRSILQYADKRSIVLGDEICKGTESTSALSIMSASIETFSENEVTFILATHFHKLKELEVISKLQNIDYKHLAVEYTDEKIIYNRKIIDGTGDAIYGLEVAKFIIKDYDFIKKANKTRNHIVNKTNFTDIKTSKYNSDFIVDACEICESKEDLDVHHIIEQKHFKINKLNREKNSLCNLVTLCKKHHHEVHNKNLTIRGYVFTSNGIQLDYSYTKSQKPDRKKFSQNDIEIINKFKEDKRQIKLIISELSKNNITISATTLKKIWKEKY